MGIDFYISVAVGVMAPSPSDYSSEGDFVSACIKQRQDEHPSEDVDQSTAICYSMWEDKSMKQREADKKPYGDVEYADPGFQKDGQKRYPIDTEEHIRAAWSYINQEKNQSAYTAEQVTHIKGRIVAAWKKHIDSAGPPGADDNKAFATTYWQGQKVELKRFIAGGWRGINIWRY